MEKRYQVFVSSTYADLQDERRHVIQTLMAMDCIPAGMELFPAADEEQWAFIKKIIDDCDYYILLIGGRYGSTTPEGVSFTEKEYDYAIERDLRVLAFVHENPGAIAVGKSDVDPELRARLEAFRGKVMTGRLVKTWSSADQLPGLVSLSLNKTLKTHPAVGWVRADQVASADILSELNELRKRNQELEQIAAQFNSPTEVPNLAGLDEKICMSGLCRLPGFTSESAWALAISWADLFALIAPHLLPHPNDGLAMLLFGKALCKRAQPSASFLSLNEEAYQTAKIQLMALGLVDLRYMQTTKGEMALFWSLTPRGREMLIQLRSVKSAKGTGLLLQGPALVRP